MEKPCGINFIMEKASNKQSMAMEIYTDREIINDPEAPGK